MAITPKMRAAREALERRLQRAAQRLRRGRAENQPSAVSGSERDKGCTVKLDRLQLLCGQNPSSALMELPRFRSVKGHWLKHPSAGQFQAYGRARWFRRKNSGMKFAVESDRREGWLPPYRITLFADDQTGLLPGEVLSVLEVMPDVRLTMVELAFDFSSATEVTRRFVRRHALFGKSRPQRPGSDRGADWWGTRKGSKLVKSYFKEAVFAHRVELEMRSRFLRHYGINDVFDFARLVELLPQRHIFFGRLDQHKLAARLLESGFSVRRMWGIMGVVGEMQRDLCATLNYLRREVELKNVRRLLVALPANHLAREALREWAAKWPRKQERLRWKPTGC